MWILVLRMPSGNDYALGPDPKNPEAGNGIALFPLNKNEGTTLTGVFIFDSEKQARDWMAECADLSFNGSELMRQVEPFQAEAIQ